MKQEECRLFQEILQYEKNPLFFQSENHLGIGEKMLLLQNRCFLLKALFECVWPSLWAHTLQECWELTGQHLPAVTETQIHCTPVCQSDRTCSLSSSQLQWNRAHPSEDWLAEHSDLQILPAMFTQFSGCFSSNPIAIRIQFKPYFSFSCWNVVGESLVTWMSVRERNGAFPFIGAKVELLLQGPQGWVRCRMMMWE